MNNYTYEELCIGHTEQFERTVTAQMMDDFCKISGDNNPLHCSDEYAVQNGFTGRVVYGMLTSSFYSTLAGVYLPGEHCLLHSVSTSFRKPVFINDTLTIVGKIVEKNDTFKILTINAYIKNQNNQKVSKAKIELGFQK